MADSGSGVGTPVSGNTPPTLLSGAVPTGGCLTLPEYAQIIEYDEHRFFGVHRDDFDYGCREYWTKAQRATLQHYLSVAQSMLEDELRFALCPSWVANEDQPYQVNMETRRKHVIEPGVMATASIEAGAAVDHTSDPAMIGPIATTVTAVSEVVVYYPGTTIQIVPQQMQIESGQLTIWVPRCRLVKLGLQNGPVAYETLSNFVDAVDVVRIYNDPTVQATLIWPHAHSQRCAETGCMENTQTACLYVLDGDIGNVTVRPATHVDGVWTTASPAYPGRPYKVRLNYRAGVGTIQPALKEALVRLAHVLMPTEPCSCDVVQRLWKRDRNMPPMFDRERLNCPFGTSDGAWFAWRVVQARRVVTMGTF
jgi:hypothetical protein